MIQESPTLALAGDCFSFVTKYFEIISTSSPHIYHSALVVAPKESIVWKLYESYAHPFTRVVCGVSRSWDTNTAATTHSSEIELVVWSPCNRFIAITLEGTWMVDVLDSATLQHVQTLESPHDMPTDGRMLAFSPDSSILTCSSGVDEGPLSQELAIVTWDLQTGGIAGTIRHQAPDSSSVRIHSLAYSADGKMVGYSRQYCNDYYETTHMTVFIFDLASGVHVYSHSLYTCTPFLDNIWAHNESFQFATVGWQTITLWEVGFAPGATLAEVETISVPYDFDWTVVQLLPTSHQLAAISKYRVRAWNVQEFKCLLNSTDTVFSKNFSLSPDGCFLACSTRESEVYLWKESLTGYILQEKLPSTAGYSSSQFSQDGKSIVTWSGHTIQLWHTEGSVTPPSTHTPEHSRQFALDFSPNGMVAVTAMQEDNIVTVLDLKSGVPQLTIDAGMEVYGLGVVGSRVFVIGMRDVVVWDLPTGDCTPDSRASLEDSLWATKLHGSHSNHVDSASISPDSNIVGFVGNTGPGHLYTHNLSTGEHLWYGNSRGDTVWFSPDGHSIWCAQDNGEAEVWEAGSISERTGLIVDIRDPPEGYPWGSSCGYQVTNDWWILGPDGNRLLMLPPPWQSHAVRRMWKGHFLALLHCGLPEAVILDLNP